MSKLKKSLCAAIAVLSAAAAGVGSASAVPTRYEAYANAAHHNDRQMGGQDFIWRHGVVYWNGQRGYPDHRRGYRYHNGYWFPEAAFLGGVIVGSTINQPGPAYGNNNAYDNHVRWCEHRYRSYRLSDDTFQPYHGPRLRCSSPYDRY